MMNAVTMIQKRLPGTELSVSEICLGTMTFGTPVGEANAIKLVHDALDHGVNFIDTANMYEGYTRFVGSNGGISEEILGKALADRRDRAVVATKVGMKVGPTPDDEHTSPAAISKQLDLSLKRLKVDCIDLYYLHRADPTTPMAEILAALADNVRAGKIRYYGVSNYSATELELLLAVADRDHLPRPVACQPPLSLLKQDLVKDLLPLCVREGIAVIPYQVLQGGLLTGKYRRDQPIPANSRKAEKDDWVWSLNDRLFDQIEAIEQQAQKEGRTMTQHAIRWALHQPGVLSVIMGVKRIEQLDEAIAAISLSEE
jgi:aryl-alcohol dehydrogenase-like predicted oxidoreductase